MNMNPKIIAAILLGLVVIIMLFNFYSKNNSKDFWNWFIANQDKVFSIKTSNEPIADEFTNRLKRVDKYLAWSIGGSASDSKRDLIISAGGIKASFPEVVKLTDAAPKNLTRWNIIAFSPKAKTDSITYNNKTVNIDDIYFSSVKSGEKYNVNVYVKNYEKGIDDSIVYLFLDSQLGEYNTEMKLGVIEIQALGDKKPADLLPLKKLDENIK